MTDEQFMVFALELADRAASLGEVPVGAVVVQGDKIVGRGHNRQITDSDPSAHAEVIAMRAAAANIGNYRLPGAVLYSTLEPCTMCLGASVHARVARIVFGAPEPRAGAIDLLLKEAQPGKRFNHIPDVTSGCLATECGDRLIHFFRDRREAQSASSHGDSSLES